MPAPVPNLTGRRWQADFASNRAWLGNVVADAAASSLSVARASSGVVADAAANFAKRNAKDGKAPTVAEVLASEDFRKSPVVRAYFAPVAQAEAPKAPARPAPPDPNAGTTARSIGKPLTDADFAGMTPSQASANRAALEEHLRDQGHVIRPRK